MAQTPLPKTTEAGGLINADTNNGQQKANFQAVWSFLDWLFGTTGGRAEGLSTLGSEGGTFGASIGVQGDFSVSGDAGVGDDLSVGDNVNANTFTVRPNADGGVYIYERANAQSVFTIYASGGALRIAHSAVGDIFVLDTGGNLTVRGNIIMAGIS